MMQIRRVDFERHRASAFDGIAAGSGSHSEQRFDQSRGDSVLEVERRVVQSRRITNERRTYLKPITLTSLAITDSRVPGVWV